MRHAELRADGVGDPVHRSQPGVRERTAGDQAGQGHVATRRQVFAVGAGQTQIFTDHPDRCQSQAVRHRVRLHRDIGLDRMGQGVQSGRGGHRWRHADMQHRVDDREGRHLQIMRHADFLLGFPIRRHRRRRDFTAGAGRRRNADQRRSPLGIHLAAAHIIQNRTAVGADHRHRFRRVHRTAAAERDHGVGVESGQLRRSLRHRLHARIGLDVGKHFMDHSLFGQAGQQSLQMRRPAGRGTARYDKDPREAVILAELRQFPDGALTEDDPGRHPKQKLIHANSPFLEGLLSC